MNDLNRLVVVILLLMQLIALRHEISGSEWLSFIACCGAAGLQTTCQGKVPFGTIAMFHDT